VKHYYIKIEEFLSARTHSHINRSSLLQSALLALENHLHSAIKMNDKSFKMTELICQLSAGIPPTPFQM